MNRRSGLTFADVLILVAIVLLLVALAIPKFVTPQDYGNEEDDVADTNVVATASPANEDSSTNPPPSSIDLKP